MREINWHQLLDGTRSRRACCGFYALLGNSDQAGEEREEAESEEGAAKENGSGEEEERRG